MTQNQSSEVLAVAILGAGFSGIGTAIQLKRAGIESFQIFERASDVGGTWRDNVYPGAACDVPSHAYSLSFEPNPGWTRRFSPSQEILGYIQSIVEKWNLRPQIRFNTAIVEARFNEDDGVWTITTDSGEAIRARVLVSCVGGLVDPSLPDIPGLKDFGGELLHTARWKQDIELEGKRVGVIGTGASAVQLVPSIAPEVKSLSVFQRTPAWVVPKEDKVYSPQQMSRLAKFPSLLRASRLLKYWLSELLGPVVYLNSPMLSRIGEGMSRRHLERQVQDPALKQKLTPNFQFGCKRMLVSDDYWRAFERKNVDLVTDSIERIESTGIRTRLPEGAPATGEQDEQGELIELDTLVLATGFELGFTKSPFPIYGRGGKTLSESWTDGAEAYKGVSVAGFPNFFILMGPNTGPGHTSVLVFTEAQMDHVVGAIRRIKDEGLKSVDVRSDLQSRYNQSIQGRMKHMVWGTGCSPWYLSADGSNRSLYPGPAWEYVLRARRFKPADYNIKKL
jgi:cation diffusion facilitator CzcD-associated flavoprotein CzcO